MMACFIDAYVCHSALHIKNMSVSQVLSDNILFSTKKMYQSLHCFSLCIDRLAQKNVMHSVIHCFSSSSCFLFLILKFIYKHTDISITMLQSCVSFKLFLESQFQAFWDFAKSMWSLVKSLFLGHWDVPLVDHFLQMAVPLLTHLMSGTHVTMT